MGGLRSKPQAGGGNEGSGGRPALARRTEFTDFRARRRRRGRPSGDAPNSLERWRAHGPAGSRPGPRAGESCRALPCRAPPGGRIADGHWPGRSRTATVPVAAPPPREALPGRDLNPELRSLLERARDGRLVRIPAAHHRGARRGRADRAGRPDLRRRPRRRRRGARRLPGRRGAGEPRQRPRRHPADAGRLPRPRPRRPAAAGGWRRPEPGERPRPDTAGRHRLQGCRRGLGGTAGGRRGPACGAALGFRDRPDVRQGGTAGPLRGR